MRRESALEATARGRDVTGGLACFDEDETTRVFAAPVAVERLGRELVLGASDGSAEVVRCGGLDLVADDDALLDLFVREGALVAVVDAARDGRLELEDAAGVSGSPESADLPAELEADLDVEATRAAAGVRTARTGLEDMMDLPLSLSAPMPTLAEQPSDG